MFRLDGIILIWSLIIMKVDVVLGIFGIVAIFLFKWMVYLFVSHH